MKNFDPKSVTGPGKNAIRMPMQFAENRPGMVVRDDDTGLFRLIIVESDQEYIIDTFILGPEFGSYGIYPRFAFYDCFVSGGSVYYIYSHGSNTYLGVSVRQENGSFARDGEGMLISDGLNPMRIFERVFIPPTDNAPLQLTLGNIKGHIKFMNSIPRENSCLKRRSLTDAKHQNAAVWRPLFAQLN
ncbi:hypothetical protein [Ereboglobus sp. PH5-10]|uniref:hypothetical protein n=1 Tax=Ereboglobus sp. PH5-10 TaxID=2940629 RepID=UPI0024064286|nr:hypothetical protein [Ereboglobus sp. PH5-10]